MYVLNISCVLLVFLSFAYATEDYQNPGLRTMIRVYDECSKAEGGFVPCLKKKAITFLDRIANIDAINVSEGIKVLRVKGTPIGRALSENELESILPRGIDDRDTKLTNLLIERATQFFNEHTLQVNFPKISTEDLGRSLEEGRGKMKKMMGMMMAGMAMKFIGLIPMSIAALYLLAGKALIVSKIALLLAGIVGLKKLLSGKGGGGSSIVSGPSVSSYSSGSSGGWSSGGGGGGHGGGGWDRRSLDDAHDLAYRGYTSE